MTNADSTSRAERLDPSACLPPMDEVSNAEMAATIKAQAQKIKELQAEISWHKATPDRISCLLDAREKDLKDLREVNIGLRDEIQRMKHAR